MEEMKQAVSIVASVYEEIVQLLSANNPKSGSAASDMLNDGISVNTYATDILSNERLSVFELKSISGLHRSFGRHLSEVEQTVYEEIGGSQLDQLLLLYNRAIVGYKLIWDYLNADK